MNVLMCNGLCSPVIPNVFDPLQSQEAACKIQRTYRACQDRFKPKIVDAKDSKLPFSQIYNDIEKIHRKELSHDEGLIPSQYYVTEKYFDGTHTEDDYEYAERILLAKKMDRIIGFLITGKDGQPEKSSEASHVKYLAVEKRYQNLGIGTKLMLEAMRRAKEDGKKYLTLEYLVEAPNIDRIRAWRREQFYDSSFWKRFKIGTGRVREDTFLSAGRRRHRFICYHLSMYDPKRIKIDK